MIPDFMEGLFVNPVTYLKTHMLLPPSGEVKGGNLSSALREMKFAQDGAKPHIIKVSLPAGERTGDFKGFYLPWNFETGYTLVLEQNLPRTLFLTAALSGCSVGIGKADDNSALRIMHANTYDSKNHKWASIEEKRRIFSAAYRWIHPTDYKRIKGNFLDPEIYDQDNQPKNYYPEFYGLVYGIKQHPGTPWLLYLQIVKQNTATAEWEIAEVKNIPY